MSHGVNISEKSDRQLADLQTAILKEQSLRRRLGASPEKIEHAIAEYQKATGKGSGESWTQPTTALDAYRIGAIVEHEGQRWVSTVSANTGTPGHSGWHIIPELDSDGNEIPPPYVRPAGAHDAFRKGYRITWTDGRVYEATRDGVDWHPDAAPEDWRLVEEEIEPESPEDDEGGPDDDEPVEPDEPDYEDEPGTIDNPLAWSGDGVDYETDQYVTYNGTVYRVQQAHRSQAGWSPDAVAALYERQD